MSSSRANETNDCTELPFENSMADHVIGANVSPENPIEDLDAPGAVGETEPLLGAPSTADEVGNDPSSVEPERHLNRRKTGCRLRGFNFFSSLRKIFDKNESVPQERGKGGLEKSVSEKHAVGVGEKAKEHPTCPDGDPRVNIHGNDNTVVLFSPGYHGNVTVNL